MTSQASAKSVVPPAQPEISPSAPVKSKRAEYRHRKAARKAAKANDLKSSPPLDGTENSTRNIEPGSANVPNAVFITTNASQPPTMKKADMSYALASVAKPPVMPLSSPLEASDLPTASYATTTQFTPTQQDDDSSHYSRSPGTVVEQPLDDLYVMIRQQRQKLFQGPFIAIKTQDVWVRGIYKRVAMAASPVLNKHFVKNPKSLEYVFDTNGPAPDAVHYLLVIWMLVTRNEFEVNAVPMQATFANNVKLLLASRMLGMERYTQHIMDTYLQYLKEGIPSYEEILIIEEFTTSHKDPLWTRMVNHLCHARYLKYIPDTEAFAAFLGLHPRLNEAMKASDKFFSSMAKKNREEERARYEARLAGERTQREKNESEKRE